jgi:hypothetical protein
MSTVTELNPRLLAITEAGVSVRNLTDRIKEILERS